jgi:arylsulfatase A-like enzyme
MKYACFNPKRPCWAPTCALLAVAALAFSPVANAQPVSGNGPRRPLPRRDNIILIVADGLGCGDLSCYGQTMFQTPNLDRLAAGGIRFTNYQPGATSASLAQASLLLGQRSEHFNANAPTAVGVTVAQALKNSGYYTGVIGQWDLGDENSAGAPWRNGFDEFGGYFDPAAADDFYADYIWRYAPKSILNSTNHQMEAFVGKEELYANVDGKRGEYIPDLYTKAAVNFITINHPDWYNHHRPFFLFLDYKIPGDGNIPVPTDAPYSDEPWPQPEKNRAAAIARLDGYIGQLLERLNKINQTSNTVIFFTSDMVPQKAGGVDPAFFHDVASTNDLRVPMIVSWPGRIPAGQVSGVKWTAADFLPTAAAIAFAKPPANIDGASVLPALFGEINKKFKKPESAAPK